MNAEVQEGADLLLQGVSDRPIDFLHAGGEVLLEEQGGVLGLHSGAGVGAARQPAVPAGDRSHGGGCGAAALRSADKLGRVLPG